ncbi:MAG: MFS transporter [Dehalococcoidales bacterium]|nr:MFS transporter [Dehalococcoidales bacterium]
MNTLPDKSTQAIRRRIFRLHPNVFFLGIVSLLTDVSSEMIFTLVPLFLRNVLGSPTTVVGLVGGISESADALFRIVSGWVSDRIGQRKLLAVLGYSISTLVKPFMYPASSWGAVLAIRFGDRIGKGVRSSSRDALIADSVTASERGRGFGLHRAMDTTGAVIGLAIAALIVYLVQGGGYQLERDTYRWMVIIGSIPAALAVLVLVMMVHERRGRTAGRNSTDQSAEDRPQAGLSTRFKVFLGIMVVFTLGNSSDFFVILRAQDIQAPLIQVVAMLVLHNITHAAIAMPMGILSDRMGRKRVIIIGWTVYALVYLGFALATSVWQVWLLFVAYGVYYGVVEGVARAFVADMVPPEQRGIAYGLYHGVIGLTLLPASVLAGWLWDTVNPAAPFYLGAGLAFVALLALITLIRE